MAQEAIRKASGKASVANPIRFQGQYHDHETGLHYNRHRYYDPASGRFVSKDPIGLAGGINVYQYAPSPIQFVDSFGLAAENEIGTYGSLNGGGNVGDGLEVHELVRHEALVRTGLPTNGAEVRAIRQLRLIRIIAIKFTQMKMLLRGCIWGLVQMSSIFIRVPGSRRRSKWMFGKGQFGSRAYPPLMRKGFARRQTLI